MFDDLKAIDFIAAVVIIGSFILTGLGVNGFVSAICIMVVSYYFGKKSSGIIIEKKTNGKKPISHS